ncbi:hypothetical protein [Pseudomonas asplenii]|uniref:hypothetical protein n=1 Tax=Pseudomonas asplenii TaxID=53407 RepID=UPI0003798A56|nr:hypothetical protein [Pseudomonas fuscovaginae]
MLVKFSEAQLAELKRLSDKKDYPAAYDYMHSVVKGLADASVGSEAFSDLRAVDTWLVTAKAINSNDRSNVLTDIVRGSIQYSEAKEGRPMSDARFQVASDKLATQTIASVLGNGASSRLISLQPSNQMEWLTSWG